MERFKHTWWRSFRSPQLSTTIVLPPPPPPHPTPFFLSPFFFFSMTDCCIVTCSRGACSRCGKSQKNSVLVRSPRRSAIYCLAFSLTARCIVARSQDTLTRSVDRFRETRSLVVLDVHTMITYIACCFSDSWLHSSVFPQRPARCTHTHIHTHTHTHTHTLIAAF